jgi:hypothetical protein
MIEEKLVDANRLAAKFKEHFFVNKIARIARKNLGSF